MTVERLCLPIAAWPKEDRLAWEAGTRRADLFEQKGAGADQSDHRPRPHEATAAGSAT
jgi:hypothetical protein